MKVLILLAVIAVAYGQHWNPNWAAQPAPVQDTPEVAAAKAAHYAAVQREQSSQTQTQWNQPQNNWGQPPNQWNQQPNQWNQPQNEPIKKWYGPLALPPGYDRNGSPLPVQDTAEVAAEKAKHFSLTGGFGAPAPQWGAQPAAPQWNQWNNAGHGRWRRSLIAAAPYAVATPFVAGAHIAHVAPFAHVAPIAHIAATPLIATHW